jgi:prophage antirepressor-like protein
MKDLIQMFNTPRSVTLNDGTVWFVGKDIAHALGYAKERNALYEHCLQLTKFINLNVQQPEMKAVGFRRDLLMINRADVNRLVLRSTLPKAVEYEKWLIETVLAEIQDTGSFIEDGKQAQALNKINKMKTTRESIDGYRQNLVDIVLEALKDQGYTLHAASMLVANVMDGIYQAALLKTASQIKFEQIDKGGALAIITTNQLRNVEAQHKIDFERAINYLNSDELNQVEMIFKLLHATIDQMHKGWFVECTVQGVKNAIIEQLKRMMENIPESVIEKHGKLYHYKGLKPLVNEINNREGKGITKSDIKRVNMLERRDAKRLK